MSMKNIYPSILDAEPDKLMTLLNIFTKNQITGIHIDVMDGNYVPSYGFNDRFINWMNKNTDFYQDVHLMVNNPENVIETFVNAGADGITVHYSATKDLYYLINEINNLDIDSGVALNPAENPWLIEEILPLVNHVLVMTCSPGRPSNGSILSMSQKVNWLNQYKKKNKLNYRIEVDGGISSKNIKLFSDNGCDDFVSGGFLTQTNETEEHINQLKNELY